MPKWRGAAPIQRAIMNMDHESGISIMKIVPKLDSGPVLLQSKIKITQDTTYEELAKKMSNLGSKLILDALKLIEEKQAVFVNRMSQKQAMLKKLKNLSVKLIGIKTQMK